MNNLVNQNGFLSEDGRIFVIPFNEEIKRIFASEQVNAMTETQLRILGSALQKTIGDAVLNNITNK
jgi:hypothetical protein